MQFGKSHETQEGCNIHIQAHENFILVDEKEEKSSFLIYVCMSVSHVECAWHFVCILGVLITKLYLLIILEKQVKSHPQCKLSTTQLLGSMHEGQVKYKYLNCK